MRTSMKTPPKPSRGCRSPRNLMRRYNEQNEQAAEIILSDPERHSRFQIDWARRYTARREQENREAVS